MLQTFLTAYEPWLFGALVFLTAFTLGFNWPYAKWLLNKDNKELVQSLLSIIHSHEERWIGKCVRARGIVFVTFVLIVSMLTYAYTKTLKIFLYTLLLSFISIAAGWFIQSI